MENNYNNGVSNNQPCKPFTELGKENCKAPNANAVPFPPHREFTQTTAPVNNVSSQFQYQPNSRVPVQPRIQPQSVDYSCVSYERYENPVNAGFERNRNYYQNNRVNNIPPQPQPFMQRPMQRPMQTPVQNPTQMPMQNPTQQYYTPVFQQQRKDVNSDMNKNIGSDDYTQPDFVRDFRTNPVNPQNGPDGQNMQNMPNNYSQQSSNPQRPDIPTGEDTYLPNMPYPVTLVAPYVPKEDKKLSGGIIAIIVVLSVLFVGSLVGLVVFAFNNSSNNSFDESKNPDASFEFTIPEEGGFDFKTNPQSDYSDKINPSYEGLDLKAKPKDKAGVKYNAEYANSVVSDSVVAILCYYGEVDDSEDYASEGSGIIISSDGYVITNSHVIDNSKTAYGIEIVTSDGERHPAGVVGFDKRTDLALLKMDNVKNLKVAEFCNLDQVALGEEVICVGNPGGIAYNHSVTKGIVSAIDRRISDTSNVKYIQTDTPINPGNSGGPVVNMYGQVIGIATSKIVSETYEGMAFAIPSNTVKEIIDELMKNGYVSGRVKLGITGYNVTAQEASRNDVPQGIRIETIAKNGPCDGVGFKKDDIITKADGKTVKSFADFYDVLTDYSAGDKIELTYYRPKNQKTDTVTIILQAAEQ